MVGIILAFKDYNNRLGFFGSEWAGLRNFEFLFKSQDAFRIIRNTIGYNLLFIVVTMAAAIAVALLLNALHKRYLVKMYQTSFFLPYFVSWVVVGFMAKILFDYDLGVLNHVAKAFGFEATAWYQEKKWWWLILLLAHLWKTIGFQSVIYYGALMGIDQQLYEAAQIDGAGRWKQTVHVTLPGILPTVIIMLVLRMGNILNVGFEKIILLYNEAIYSTSDVISTFVYRKGLQEFNYSFSTAVGLFNSVINLFFLFGANFLSKRATGSSLW